MAASSIAAQRSGVMVARMLDSPLRRYHVLSAHSAQEGLDLLQHQRPDLLLLDLKLPDMDGVQVIERLRRDPAWERLPIVVVSAQEEIDTLELLNGGMVIAKGSGLNVSDAVQWLQQIINTATQASAAPAAQPAGPAR
jgi:CheY-like chemotaxis protein